MNLLKSYNYVKDVQSCGAVIQNILLSAHSFGIGACWIGEVLEKSDEVIQMLDLSNYNIELMAIVSLGYSNKISTESNHKSLDEFIL